MRQANEDLPMQSNPANLTNEQVAQAMTYIARQRLDRDYRLIPMSERYQRMIEVAEAHMDDNLIRSDIGTHNLAAILDYFRAKRDQFIDAETAL
jgi:hypothetical protein